MEPSQCSRRRLKLFGKPGAPRRIVETRRFEGQAKQVYSLLLLQEALRLQARTVYRTVTGSSPVAGAHLVRRLAEKTKYSCVAQLAEHPTVNRTVTGSSPVAGAIESLDSPRLFYFHRIGDQTRHPIINREIHGEDLTTTHIRQTGHCQFTDERHGIPSISLGIPCKSYIETLVRGMAESIGKSGALGATPASTRFTPSMATMAPLSVQSLICGIRTSTP